MEIHFKPGDRDGGGTHRVAAPPQARPYRPSPFYSSSSESLRTAGFVLRGAAALLSFVAAVVLGSAKQTKTVTFLDTSTLSPTTVTGTVKSTDSSAYVYFVIINVLVFVYSAAAIAAALKRHGGSGAVAGEDLYMAIADLAVVVFLQSCNGAAANTSVIAEHGSWRLGWGRICNIVGRFCGQAAAGIVLSMLAAVAYVALVVLAIVTLHRRAT